MRSTRPYVAPWQLGSWIPQSHKQKKSASIRKEQGKRIDEGPGEGEDEVEEIRRTRRDAAAEEQVETVRDSPEAGVVGSEHRQTVMRCGDESGNRLLRGVSRRRRRHTWPLEWRRRSGWLRKCHCLSLLRSPTVYRTVFSCTSGA